MYFLSCEEIKTIIIIIIIIIIITKESNILVLTKILLKIDLGVPVFLRPYNVRDATLVSESKLLLARAGMCVVHLQNICKGSFYIYSLAGTI